MVVASRIFTGGVALESSTGGVTLESSTGGVALESSVGDVVLESSVGDVALESSVGDVALESSVSGVDEISVYKNRCPSRIEGSQDPFCGTRLFVSSQDSSYSSLREDVADNSVIPLSESFACELGGNSKDEDCL